MNLNTFEKVLEKTSYILTILIIGYFITRLFNLTNIPIFNDESTYIRYGIHQLNEPIFKPYSLLIGKEPLLPQLFAAFSSAMGNLLVGARLVSVLIGLLTLLGLFFLTLNLENKRVAFFVGILYILSPFNLFYDRLALLDSGVSAIAVWTLYLTYLIFLNPKWYLGAALGVVAGIGLYIKTTNFFYLVLPFICIGAIFLFKKIKYGKDKVLSLKIFLLSGGLAFLIYAPLYFNELYKVHLSLLKQYTYPLTSVFSFPINVWFSNIEGAASWIIMLLTIPIFILAIYGMVKNIKNPKYLFVFFWLVFPLLYQLLYEKLFTSRHVLLSTIPLLIFAGWALNDLLEKKKVYYYFAVSTVVAFCLFYNFFIWFKPYELPNYYVGRTKLDVSQYFGGFASGYGVTEAMNYLKDKSRERPIVVLTRDDHGNPEDAVVAYLAYNPSINLGLIMGQNQVKQVYDQVGGAADIYFVSRGAYYLGMEKYLTEEKKFLKPDGKDFVGVYKIKF